METTKKVYDFLEKPALGENGENGVMYYLKDATASFFNMTEMAETVKF